MSSFYHGWLNIVVLLLPLVVKHSKIVFCFCLEWLSTMFSFCSWWLSFGLLLPFRWLSVFASVKWLSIVLWLLLNGLTYSNCLWMFFSHFQSAANVFPACFIVYFSTCIVHPKLEVLTPPSISWGGVCCLLISTNHFEVQPYSKCNFCFWGFVVSFFKSCHIFWTWHPCFLFGGLLC